MFGLFLLIPFLLSGCGYIKPTNQQMLNKAHQFITFYENNEFAVAYALLTNDAQSKLSYQQFSNTPGDFLGVTDAFRQAGIITRNTLQKDEPTFYVSKLRGREGVLKFVMVQENGEWKIANILEETLEPSKN